MLRKTVKLRRTKMARAKGNHSATQTFGMTIPRELLANLGWRIGDSLSVSVRGKALHVELADWVEVERDKEATRMLRADQGRLGS